MKHEINGEVTLPSLQGAGFPMGGESLSVDLADTLVTVTDPQTDLLASEEANQHFWSLHGPWLPKGWAAPDVERTRELRGVIRRLFDGVISGDEASPRDLAFVNATAAKAPTTYEVVPANDAFAVVERWHTRDPEALALASAARSAIDMLTEATHRKALRRCANPACSMLFFKGDARRRWCTPNICANRDRAARHYARHRKEKS